MSGKKRLKRLLIGAVTLLLASYALASTYIYARQTYFIFSPKRIIAHTPAEYQLRYENVLMNANAGTDKPERLHAWWLPAEYPSNRVLIYLHGSALNIGANITHARRFIRMGFSVLLVSYRGYGISEGSFPSEMQVYEDARVAWAYLVEQKGIDPGNIIVYGHSLGGAVAIQLAVEHPEAGGVIVEAAFTSIADLARQIPKYRVFPTKLLVHQRFDSLQKVPQLRTPILYIHGTSDRRVPFEMSRKLYQRTASAKRLKLILGGGHNNSAAVGADEYLKAVKSFIEYARRPI